MAEEALRQAADAIIREARERKASDIHISEGMPIWYRVNGRLLPAQTQMSAEEIRGMLYAIMPKRHAEKFEKGFDADFSFQTSDGHRQRVNVFRQQKKMAGTIRLLNASIPTLEELKMPTVLYEMAKAPRGLILVTGPTGSGKSTTLAAMIEYMNQNSDRHIITIEDPIEYVYETKKSLIHQREVGEDVGDFASALRSALREDPDVILVGEMRDYDSGSFTCGGNRTSGTVYSAYNRRGTDGRASDRCLPDGRSKSGQGPACRYVKRHCQSVPDPVWRRCDPCGRYGTSGSNGCDPEPDPGRKDTSDFQYDAVGNSSWHAYSEYGSGTVDAAGIYYQRRCSNLYE